MSPPDVQAALDRLTSFMSILSSGTDYTWDQEKQAVADLALVHAHVTAGARAVEEAGDIYEYIARYLPAISQREIRPKLAHALAVARRQAIEECLGTINAAIRPMPESKWESAWNDACEHLSRILSRSLLPSPAAAPEGRDGQ